MTQPQTHSRRDSRGINLSSHSRAVPLADSLSPGASFAPVPGSLPRRPPKDAPRALKRHNHENTERTFPPPSARELVLSVASWVEAERIEPTKRIVFPIARAAGATFPDHAGQLWLALDRAAPERRRAKAPRNPQEWSRRILIVSVLAIERGRGQGRGIIRRARDAARAAGAKFDNRRVDGWLARFVRVDRREHVRRRNLKQFAAVWEAVRGLELVG